MWCSLRPGDEGAAGELRAVVGPDGRGIAAEDGRSVEQPRDVLARDAVVDRDVDALVAEVVGDRQALQALRPLARLSLTKSMLQTSLTVRGRLQRHALDRRAAHLLALAHGQVRGAVEPVDALVVDARELRAQQIVDAPIAEAPAHVRDLDDPAGQLARGGISLGRVAVAVAGEPHKTTRAALGQVVLADHPGDRLALDLWG